MAKKFNPFISACETKRVTFNAPTDLTERFAKAKEKAEAAGLGVSLDDILTPHYKVLVEQMESHLADIKVASKPKVAEAAKPTSAAADVAAK